MQREGVPTNKAKHARSTVLVTHAQMPPFVEHTNASVQQRESEVLHPNFPVSMHWGRQDGECVLGKLARVSCHGTASAVTPARQQQQCPQPATAEELAALTDAHTPLASPAAFRWQYEPLQQSKSCLQAAPPCWHAGAWYAADIVLKGP